jgi:hypothetical protein
VSSFSSDCIFIFDKLDNWILDEPNGEKTVAIGHCCLTLSADKMEFGIQGPDCIEVDTVKPATKIQRDLLFKTMADAGYTFDFEKKELKEVKQEKTMHNKLTDFESSLKHIMEEAIECGDTRNLKADADMLLRFAQKSAVWSEEDEKIYSRIYNLIHEAAFANYDVDEDGKELGEYAKITNWFKSLKGRVQPKEKWCEEDKEALEVAIIALEDMYDPDEPETYAGYTLTFDKAAERLKSLKERVQPRPKQEWSEDDEKNFNEAISYIKDTALRNWLKSRVGCEVDCTNTWKPSDAQPLKACFGY